VVAVATTAAGQSDAEELEVFRCVVAGILQTPCSPVAW
jgi:hypothetical protein